METPRNEVDVLFPDRDVTLAGKRVVRVRELTFGESLAMQRHRGFLEFIVAAHALAEPGRVPDDLALIALGAEHPDWWLAFLSKATGLTADEIVALSPLDGALLAISATGANAGFFAVAVTMHRRPSPTTPTDSPSPTPSPSSSDTDTETLAP